MRRFSKFVMGAAVCVSVAALPQFLPQTAIGAADMPEGGMKDMKMAPKDIVDTAMAAGQFKTLASALKAADLVDTLKGEGPFTVFAPTDEAFAKIPAETLADLMKPENKEKLAGILTYHVVPAKAMASDVAGMKTAKTVNGKELRLSATDGKVMVNDAKVTKADIVCTNGVIHVIDTVLMP